MTATARRMRRGARTITTGKQLIGQLHGPATHVGPNALLRSASYPAPTTAPGTGPLRNPALPSGNWFQLNGATEFQPANSDAHAGAAYNNWASGPTTTYAYNNSPGNYGGLVPSGGLVIDGFPVAAGAEVYQFLDFSTANEVELEAGVPSGGVVFRGCRFRGYTDGSSNGFIAADSGYDVPLLILYCDLGGKGINPASQYSNDSIQDLATTSLVVYRSYFSLHGTALQPNGSVPAGGPCDILENYMENWIYNSGDHDNGISASGGGWTCCRWQRNYVVLEAVDANGQQITQTDAISLGSDGSPPANDNIGTGTNPDGTTGFQITHNYCAGGSDTYYLGQSGGGTPNTVTGLNFANNLLSTSSWPDGGNSGPTNAVPPWNSSSPPNTKSNNLWADGPDAGTTFI